VLRRHVLCCVGICAVAYGNCLEQYGHRGTCSAGGSVNDWGDRVQAREDRSRLSGFDVGGHTGTRRMRHVEQNPLFGYGVEVSGATMASLALGTD